MLGLVETKVYCMLHLYMCQVLFWGGHKVSDILKFSPAGDAKVIKSFEYIWVATINIYTNCHCNQSKCLNEWMKI